MALAADIRALAAPGIARLEQVVTSGRPCIPGRQTGRRSPGSCHRSRGAAAGDPPVPAAIDLIVHQGAGQPADRCLAATAPAGSRRRCPGGRAGIRRGLLRLHMTVGRPLRCGNLSSWESRAGCNRFRASHGDPGRALDRLTSNSVARIADTGISVSCSPRYGILAMASPSAGTRAEIRLRKRASRIGAGGRAPRPGSWSLGE